MRVLVTGAGGLLGRALLPVLQRAGHEVSAFELPSCANRCFARRGGAGVAWHWGDIRADCDLRPTLGIAAPEVVVHSAAMLPPFTEEQPTTADEVNVGGTAVLLAALADQATPARFIYPSSVTVYGPDQSQEAPRAATDPTTVSDHYSRHKLTCEALIRDSGLPHLLLRVGVVLEPGYRRVPSRVLRALFEVHPDNRLETIATADVARAIGNAIDSTNEGLWNRVLCIGGGEANRIRQRDLLSAAFAALGFGAVPEAAFGTSDFYTHWMDSEQSEALLHYQRHSFDDYRHETTRRLRWLRRLLWPIRPLARWAFLRLSRPWREGKDPAA